MASLKLEKRYRIEIGELTSATVMLVGCGGTGSFAALHLARLAWAAGQRGLDIQLIFVDPDRVEAKNVGRQNFCPAEIGRAKAETLASRFGLAFGLKVEAEVGLFRPEMIYESRRRYDEHLLLVGAVDTVQARHTIHVGMEKDIESSRPCAFTWWLDAGNDEHSGQVLLGNRIKPKPLISPLGVCTGLPIPGVQEPGLVAVGDRGQGPGESGKELSCAELMALEAQSLMINQAMAGWVGVYSYRLLLGRDLDLMATYVDQLSGTVRSKAITGGEMERLGPMGQEDTDQARARRQAGRVAGERARITGRTLEQWLEEGLEMAMAEEEERVCPECGAALAEGRDVIDEEIGEEDIIFCTLCDWRMYLEDYEAEREEVEQLVAETGV